MCHVSDKMTPFSQRLFLLLVCVLLGFITAEMETVPGEGQCSAASSSTTNRKYYHLIVLVHGYMGSFREQEYLGEAMIEKSETILKENDILKDNDNSCRRNNNQHRFVILNSRANTNDSTDGIIKGGQRLVTEVSEWIQHHTTQVRSEQSDSNSIMTLTLIGNSLGGLYCRYALAELDALFDDGNIHPLLFATTSTPHLGVSQETFLKLPRWTEPWAATVLRQETMNDMFGVNNSTIVMDMCRSTHDGNGNGNGNGKDNNRGIDYLRPLQRFQKRIAVANAYNTDFLVSVSSGAFLSSDSDSVHHRQDRADTGARSASLSTTRLLNDSEHVALQVTTSSTTIRSEDNDNHNAPDNHKDSRSSCANSLDRLGWHKIFLDTRSIIPAWMRLSTPALVRQPSYTSRELCDQFKRFGTLLPIAHPLNMANSRTDWY